EEEVSSDENEIVEVKVLMALADDESGAVGKEIARNGEWVKISMRKVHTLFEMEDNDERKSFLDYLGVDLNFVEEQRHNLMIKHRDIVQELNTGKEKLLELKQAKLDFLTMQHVNTEIIKENQNLRKELKELTAITETWLNSSNNVNQCISEQILNQKKIILGVDQLTEYPSSSRKTDPVFVKSSADNTNVSIPNVERPWLSEAKGFNLPNHDTAEESSSVCSTPLPPLEKLAGAKLVLDVIPSLLKKVTKALDRFAQAIKLASHKTGDQSVPSASQAALEKTIIPPVTITTYSLIIPTTLPFQPPFLSRPPKTTHQLKGKQVKKDKGKNKFSHEEVKEEESESNSEAEVRLIGSLVESSKKTLKKFAYINEQGETCLMIEEEIKNQKKIEQTVKANVAKDEIKQGKEELIDLLLFDVVESMYKAKMKYDKYCIKMLNTRAQGKITNCDVLSRGKGTITLKVNTDDGFDEIIQNFKANDLYLRE
ncbi:hypothetical protein Tco_1119257, partial [Tanacetum coccineum]